MSNTETGTPRIERVVREAYSRWGEIICDSCDETVDLEDADSVNGAGDIWNDHLRECDEVTVLDDGAEDGEWVTYVE